MGKCNNLILHCMDYRIQEILEAWTHRYGLTGNVDRISIGGPCKDHETALRYIRICIEKHGVKNVFISQHEDCAGYGGHEAFPSLEAEHEKILGDMRSLRDTIKSEYSDVEVTMLLVKEADGKWKIEEIKG